MDIITAVSYICPSLLHENSEEHFSSSNLLPAQWTTTIKQKLLHIVK